MTTTKSALIVVALSIVLTTFASGQTSRTGRPVTVLTSNVSNDEIHVNIRPDGTDHTYSLGCLVDRPSCYMAVAGEKGTWYPDAKPMYYGQAVVIDWGGVADGRTCSAADPCRYTEYVVLSTR
jgi:hypothetical protein